MLRSCLIVLPVLFAFACNGSLDSDDEGRNGPTGGSTGHEPSGHDPSSAGGADGMEAGGGTSGGSGPDGQGAGGASAGAGPFFDPDGTLTEEQLDLAEKLADVADWDAATLERESKVSFETLSYDPSEALGLDLIQSSALGMTDAEMEKFQENGFVISTDNAFPTFAYGYASIYASDLPVYVSADSLLYAMHRSFDTMLKEIEMGLLLPELESMLSGLRAGLAESDWGERTKKDLDLYLTVAESLVKNGPLTPLVAGNTEMVERLFDACIAASGQERVELLGQERDMDFSQFKPRGHYTENELLKIYFRSMMWLGRVDFRLMGPNSSGELELKRRQVEAMIALRTLMDESIVASYEAIDDIVTAFIGDQDYMTAPQVDDLMADLGITDAVGLSAVSDVDLADAIRNGRYGLQQISSHILKGGLGQAGTTPLPPSFALLGQRYVLDSHVFSNVVWDRVTTEPRRMMPKPLDVAYAALKNDQAGMLLESELETYDYASDLQSMRVLVDSEPAATWEKNLYGRWLSALRFLSPAHALSTDDGESLPEIAKTEAWGRRLLNTQLASWAELRHDTILYAKQSYTSAASCEFPDAYVDPYPEFFGAVGGFAEHTLGLLAKHELLAEDLGLDQPYDFSDPETIKYRFMLKLENVLHNFVTVAATLKEMAEHQRTGAPHSAEHIEFINEIVRVSINCDGTPLGASGWYGSLFLDASAAEWAPTVADVHTQPTTESGGDLGRILHIGTGDAHLMVTTVDTCAGPRAYVGLVSSYYEFTRDNWVRLNDEEWEEVLQAGEEPASPDWVRSLSPD